MPGIEFFEPADAHDLRSCLDWAIGTAMCPVFVRLHSGTVEPLACNARMLGAYVAHEPASTPQIVLIGSGLPVADLVDVAKALDAINIGARVVNVVAPKRLDAAFTAMLVDGAPALTVYNGNPDVLASAVSACILAHPGPRPSRVVRHGFTLGTSGQLANLARHFRLDAQGIAEVLETCGIIEKQLVAGAS